MATGEGNEPLIPDGFETETSTSLDALRQDITQDDFMFLTFNEDVRLAARPPGSGGQSLDWVCGGRAVTEHPVYYRGGMDHGDGAMGHGAHVRHN